MRFFVTNKLPERTSVHWHGILLPNGMDGVAGLNQPHIEPGETYVYEFTLRQHGVFMYHPHSDEMVQMAMGMMGFFVIHPRGPRCRRSIATSSSCSTSGSSSPGTATPNPTRDDRLQPVHVQQPRVARHRPLGREEGRPRALRVRQPAWTAIRSTCTATASRRSAPTAARSPSGASARDDGERARRRDADVEFVADVEGDWAFHCHKSHHTMNAMSHDVPNFIGTEMKRDLVGLPSASSHQDICQWARLEWPTWPRWQCRRPQTHCL